MSQDNVLKKEFKKQDVQRLRNVLTGKAGERTTEGVGYTKAKDFYKVDIFEHIISVGDGIWDLRTARNLKIHFIGILDKNLIDFQREKIKCHIKDWQNFDLHNAEKQLEII